MFVPISDDNSQRVRVPFVNLALIALNAVVFLLELGANSQGGLEAFVRHWAAVPVDYTGRSGGYGGPVPLTLLTSMFLHGGWMHLGGNMLYLWIFGDNLEKVMGAARFALFYIVCGLAASFAHIAFGPGSSIPAVGASGAISGVLGGYLLLFPHNRVRVLTRGGIAQVPALVVLGLWIVIQLINGVGSVTATAETAGVAYMAHIGGFVAGLVLVKLMATPRRLAVA